MDCNKEEANRAKELAERKMESKDFVNAKKVAQKAQKLYPDLKDISQMILVCEVHCAAQKKVYGNENDWYGILQVEPTADEMSIKKQYRKLALLLHPDKNKLAGASDAFKFVGEAQKVLLDSEKRMMYDRKCKSSGRYPVLNRTMQQGSRPSNPRGVHSWFQNPFPNNAPEFMNQQHQPHNQHMQSGSNNHRPTFWTVCPFCSMRYQYYKDLINRTLVCQACKKSFSGFEMNEPVVTSGTNFSQPTYSQQGGGVSHNHATPGPRSTSKRFSSRSANQANIHVDSSQERIFTSDKVLKKKRKRRNRSVESSESLDSESSTDVGEDMVLGEKYGCHSEQNLRRSARSKQKVSYDENLSSDDDLVEPSKRSKSSGFFSAVEVEEDMFHKEAADAVGNQKEVKLEENFTKLNLQNGQKEAGKSYEQASVSKDNEKNIPPTIYEYPDPEFSDFDKERREECFATGQIWAVYDTTDAMPRFYALIRKVQLHGFKLQITWLEPNPDDDDEIMWVTVGLPVSCGKFRLGSKENCEDHAMFSHLVCWEKGSRRNSYKIYPRKGETWAIFKNWDINWHSDPQRKNKYEFEFVEILSDYVDDTGIQVAYLCKLKGFACLFGRTRKDDMDPVLIPAKEMFKFSHKVPSFRMTGKEGKNVPAGTFELDPASLPDLSVLNGSCSKFPEDRQGSKIAESKEGTQSLPKEEISEEKDCFIDTVNLKGDATKIHLQNIGSKGNSTMANMMEPIILSDESDEELGLEAKHFRKSSSLGQAEVEDCQKFGCNGSDGLAKGIVGSPSRGYDVPDQVFHDFDAARSLQKIKVGQIWAVYSDEDALPKYYGMVQKIDGSSNNGFELHFRWLVHSSSKRVIPWKDNEMPICCGKFKLGETLHKYNSIAAFSHEVRVETKYENQNFSIFPQPGEVWALYKGWSPEMKAAELEDCRYHIVEVLRKDNFRITVMDLDQVDGFKSIFKPRIEGQKLRVTMDIPLTELLRFSHRIPAFRLTEEKEGSLRGFLELDTAAIPLYYFCHS